MCLFAYFFGLYWTAAQWPSLQKRNGLRLIGSRYWWWISAHDPIHFQSHFHLSCIFMENWNNRIAIIEFAPEISTIRPIWVQTWTQIGLVNSCKPQRIKNEICLLINFWFLIKFFFFKQIIMQSIFSCIFVYFRVFWCIFVYF